MTLNNFIEAIAGKLAGVWPDRKVYVDEIPKDADGQFFVGIIESGQEAHLDRPPEKVDPDRSPVLPEIEGEYGVQRLGRRNVRPVRNADRERNGSEDPDDPPDEPESQTGQERPASHQFTFDADFFFVLTPAEIPFMENLGQTEEIK